MTEIKRETNQSLPWVFRDLNADIRVNVADYPISICDFYNKKDLEKISFRGELYYLKKILLEERKNNYPPKTEFYRILYIAMCDYYMGHFKYSVEFFNMALALNEGKHLYPLINFLKYNVVKLKRVLLIVCYEKKINYNFIRLNKINTNIVVKFFDSYDSLDQITDEWQQYDQVFLFGHGDEDKFGQNGYILLGDKEFTPIDLKNYVYNNIVKPKVIGIFSCGNGFENTEIHSEIDYFITDTYSSVPHFIEMFINGYLTEYFYNYNIHSAFNNGKLATLFSAVSNPSYKIYSRGILIQT